LLLIDTVNDIVHQDSGSSLVYRIHHIMKVLYLTMLLSLQCIFANLACSGILSEVLSAATFKLLMHSNYSWKYYSYE